MNTPQDHTRPRRRELSPCCSAAMTGGPVVFTCCGCRHDVHGSTVDREVALTGGAR